MRNIIQITSADIPRTAPNPDAAALPVLYALCDDGTVWYQTFDRITKMTVWLQTGAIPQG